MIGLASIAIVVGLGLFAVTANASDRCSASSASQHVPLVELYTSEGCSSCPPADRWLSALKRDAQAGRLLPLAFHVDYWDYIGWKDSYAQAVFSRRQRELANRGGARTIYTPQVMVDSRDLPGWRNQVDFEAALATSARRPAGVNLSMDLHMESAARWIVDLRGKRVDGVLREGAIVFLALYENGIETRVKSGENAGTTLRHDYVVRNWLGPFRITEDGGTVAHANIAIEPDWKARDLGLAAVAYSAQRGEILQTINLPSCVTAPN